MLSKLYRIATDLGAPAIDLYLHRRMGQGREDATRFRERLGYASRPRPAGPLVWCHAASVGEAVSLLLLIEKLRQANPDLTVLLTTGTVTAARMMVPRLPPYALHQYIPIDRMPCIDRFLDHWQPTLAVWVESELWPNTLSALRMRRVPAVLLNARMSYQSFRNWYRVKRWARQLMSTFNLCLAQTEDDRGRFIALGARPVKCLGNLKYASMPLPCDADELALLQEQIAGRQAWLFASTHRGEESIAITAHRTLEGKHPDVLTIIVPRHAARGDEIAELIRTSGLRFARRSKGDAITPETQIYLADTMGELGLFYRLCPVAVLGGSFVHIGGHNPIEAAQLGAAVLTGPIMHNFAEITHEFLREGAIMQMQHANEIPFNVERLFTNPALRDKYARAAYLLAEQKRHILDHIMAEIQPWLLKQA